MQCVKWNKPMLSAKSEQFLLELRMYLIRHAKSDEDVNRTVKDLEVRLVEAEQNGESLESIIGHNPTQYITDIGKSLPMDKKELLILIPFSILVILAYLSYLPAVEGNFRLSQSFLVGGAVIMPLTLGLYAVIVLKELPKFFRSPGKLGLFMMGLSVLVTGIWVVFYFWMRQQADFSYYIATTAQNFGIAAMCIAIFILYTLYTKSWLTLIVAGVMTIAPIGEKLIPKHINEDPLYITLTFIGMLVVGGVLIYYLIKKKKENPEIF